MKTLFHVLLAAVISMTFCHAGAEAMRSHPEILINHSRRFFNDSPVCDRCRTGNDVHFHQKSEHELLGHAVADAVIKALQLRKP